MAYIIMVIALLPSIITLIYTFSLAIYTAILHKSPWSGYPPEVQVLKFMEGNSVFLNNPVFIGIAAAQSFAPSSFAEYMYYGELQSWCLFAMRLLALGLCSAFWIWLYKLNYSSLTQYIRERFKNRFLIAIYNLNKLIGGIYAYTSNSAAITYTFFEYFKTNYYATANLFTFLVVTSLGGFPTTLIAVLVMSFLGFISQMWLLVLISPVHNFGAEMIQTKSSECYTNYALNEFIPFASQLIAVLPTFNLFRTAGSLGKMKIAIIICCVVLLYDQLVTMAVATKLKEFGKSQNPCLKLNTTSGWIRCFLSKETKENTEISVDLSSHLMDSSTFNKWIWDIPPVMRIFLFWSLFGHLSVFAALHLHTLTIHIIDHCLPNWLHNVVTGSVTELKIIYSFLRFLLSIIVLLILEEGIYRVVRPEYKGKIVYIPLSESILTIAVGMVTLIGWMVHSAGSAVITFCAVVQIVGMFFIETILSREIRPADFIKSEEIWSKIGIFDPNHDQHLCLAAWLPSLVAVGLSLILLPTVILCQGRPSYYGRFSVRQRRSSDDEDSEESESNEGSK